MSPSATLRYPTVARVLDAHQVGSVVEVGPGMGATSWRIARGRRYVGYEPDPISHSVATARLAEVNGAVVYNQTFPAEPPADRFDALVAFEVLEHIEDDESALRQWVEWLRPGGLLLISVPAHQRRFGPWDRKVGHHRRYERDEVVTKLEASGLTRVSVEAWGMPVGFLLEWVRQRWLADQLSEEPEHEIGTARSGRSFQPSSGGRLLNMALAPFVYAQRPFAGTGLGIGWIAWGTRAS